MMAASKNQCARRSHICIALGCPDVALINGDEYIIIQRSSLGRGTK